MHGKTHEPLGETHDVKFVLCVSLCDRYDRYDRYLMGIRKLGDMNSFGVVLAW